MPKFNFGRDFKKKLRQIRNYYDLEFLVNILKVCGLWPPMNGHKKCYMIRSVFTLFLTSVHLPFAETVFAMLNWNNIRIIVASMYQLNQNYIHVFKVYLFLRHQKRIQRLLDYADAKEFSCDDSETVTKTKAPIFIGCLYLLGVCKILHRITASTISYLKGQNNRVLPVLGWYPYDELATPFYELTLVLQSLTLFMRCAVGAAFESLIIGLMPIVARKFEILKTRIKKIGDDVSQFGTKSDPRMNVLKQRDIDERRYEQLMMCVKQHLAIFEFAMEFQQIFQWTMFLQLVNNCGGLCTFTIDILLAMKDHPAEWITSLGPGMGFIVQMFIYCYFGNVISVQSQSVVDAAYAGNWWRFDERYKSALRLLMIRANKPVVIQVGSIFTLSLPTFVTIMRTTYSYFTVLKTTIDRKQE